MRVRIASFIAALDKIEIFFFFAPAGALNLHSYLYFPQDAVLSRNFVLFMDVLSAVIHFTIQPFFFETFYLPLNFTPGQ